MADENNLWQTQWWFTPPPPPPGGWWAVPPPPPPPPPWAWAPAAWAWPTPPPQDEGPVVPIWEFWRTNDFKSNIELPPHETTVDDQKFLKLLAWSISLSIDEKKKIIENFWQLSQFQVDELIKIFEEEKSKFAALDVKHKEQLKALERQHAASWDAFEAESQQEEQSKVEDVEAEEIRKSLWLDN